MQTEDGKEPSNKNADRQTNRQRERLKRKRVVKLEDEVEKIHPPQIIFWLFDDPEQNMLKSKFQFNYIFA